MDSFPVRYSPMALEDLNAVWDDVYEASKETEIADRYLDGLMAKVSEKKYFPLSGSPLMYGNLFTGYYSVNYKMYKVFYRVRDGFIDVARIIMCRRDYMKVLFGEEDPL